jgi:hypothetical protein
MLRCLIAALVALAAFAPINSNAVSQENSRSYSGGGVTIDMSQPPGAVLNPGDEIGFRLLSETDAYVIVFNIDTEGFVNLLYPAKGERPVRVREGGTYLIPDDSSELLVVEGRTGVEFLFVLAVPDRDDIDRRELDYLGKANDLPASERYRIDGDPFIAANIIAGELVRGISRRDDVFLDYTYFFINERVAYPCYLCGDCDDPVNAGCGGYIVTANFDENHPLTYPMQRGYEMIEPAASPVLEDNTGVADAGDAGRTFGQYQSDDGSVNVNFYPYNSEVYYETRETMTGGTDVDIYLYGNPYYDPWYYPWYYGWYYYPTVSVGFYWGPPSFWWGFNWGWWGGYYCSAWYWPRCYTVYDHYRYDYCWYNGGYHYSPERYKDKYYRGDVDGRRSPYKEKYATTSAYQKAYAQAAKRDSKMKLASASVRGKTAEYRKAPGATTARSAALARGAKSIGKTTRVRGLYGSRSASGAKYAYQPKTRMSYAPKTRKSYGVTSPYSRSRTGSSSLKARSRSSSASRYPAYRGRTVTPHTRSSRSIYDRTRSGGVYKSRATSKRYTPGTTPRTQPRSVDRRRSSTSSRPGYKPTSRSSRSSGSRKSPAVKSSRSSSRSPARSSGARRSSSGGRSKSGGKGRR